MADITPAPEENPNMQDVQALLAVFNGARYPEAATQAQTMTGRFPRHPFGWKVLGAALRQLGRKAEALACAQKVVALAPADAEAHSNLGAMLKDLGRLEEAASCARQALAIKPDYAEAHYNLGVALKDLGRLEEAVTSYRRTLELKADWAEAHNNLGIVLNDLGRPAEAEASYRRALELNPGLAKAHNNLGNVLKDFGQLAEAATSYRRALEFKPDFAEAHSNLIFALLYRSGNEREVIAAELRRWNELHAVPLARFMVPHVNDRAPERRLRLGYVSHDFITHSVAFFLLPLLESHDRERFHVSCYTSNPRSDEVTVRLRACADQWHNLAGASDEAIAEQIRADRIDLLIDLSGHTAGNRLRVFARKPAPVQISCLGFPCATGLGTIDYRLTDPWADPPGAEVAVGAEQLVRLPETAWCFSPLSGGPPVGAQPALHGAPVSFGCFNNFSKVTDEMLGLWGRILQRVPGARLILKNTAVGNASAAQRVQAFFLQRGIGPERLKLLPHTRSPVEHLECYNAVDVALDTFPYHGTTTTCEALWMGVPVITLAGSTHVARVGVSLLTNVGLPELVASSMEDYGEKAVGLARDLPRLAELRAGLRERMAGSPLMDAPRFTRHVEAAYRVMWQRWCAQPEAAPGVRASSGQSSSPAMAEVASAPEENPNLQDVQALLTAFNGARYLEAATQAQAMTGRFPRHPFGWKVLGAALRQLGQKAEALACAQKVVALAPADAEAHNNLGNVLTDLGQQAEAVASYRRALAIKPDYAQAHSNLGNVLKDLGLLAEAVVSYRRALELNPGLAEAHNNLGNVLKDFGQLAEAATSYRRALELKPDFAEAHNNLGLALNTLGRLAEAEASYRRALTIKPDYAQAHNNLGNVLKDFGQLAEAATSYRRALELKPDFAEAHNNLGNAQREFGRFAEAVASYRVALAIKPDYAEAHSNLGTALRDLGQLTEAEASYRRALELKPDFAEAHSNLGAVLNGLGCLDEAVSSFRRALAINPDLVRAHSNLILTLLYQSGDDAETIAAELGRWGERHAVPLARFILPHTNDHSPERRLRIGYVSPDFRSHPVGWFLRPLLAAHDHQSFEIFCYSTVRYADDFTAQLRTHADGWRELAGRTDRQAADLIRADRIDILVDLALHTANNRLPVFALKPAPVQVTYLAYPGNSGLDTIDYRMTDRHLDPPDGAIAQRAEQLFRLPETYWCYQPVIDPAPAINPLPALKAGQVTFGCLNNFCKVTPNVLITWTRILTAMPDTSLILYAQPGAHRLRVQGLFSHYGVDLQRLRFVERRPLEEYFQTYSSIDVALDPFPFPGGTTTCDALWMGVPVISLAGPTPVTRGGLSLLSNVGLPELVASSAEQYVEKAVALARDLPRLAELRADLRERMQRSPLMDAPRFARHIESAYRTMWRQWCVRQQAALAAAVPSGRS